MSTSAASAEAAIAASGAREAGLFDRLLNGRVAAMLVRNSVVSCATFLLDLILLWVFVEQSGLGKMEAASIAFLIATSVHYGFCRSWVFKGTSRALGSGYFYFLLNAAVGLALTLSLFWLFMMIGLHYLVARVIASVFAGLTVFVLNALFNFRSV